MVRLCGDELLAIFAKIEIIKDTSASKQSTSFLYQVWEG